MTTARVPDLRRCHLYRIYVWNPSTGYTTKVLGYVGETVREPIERLREHVEEQPWADTIVAWVVDDDVYPGKPAVLRAEAATIRAEKPLYNVTHNERNRDRIDPPEATRQRRARDAAEPGKTRWVHPDDRPVAPPPARARAARRQPAPRWKVLRNRAFGWLAAWTVLTGGGWWGIHTYLPLGGWRDQTALAAGSALALLVWGRRQYQGLRKPKRRRGRPRRR